MSKKYNSTFTPSGEPEDSKICPECDQLLEPGKYKMKYGSRDGIEGCIRNRTCRSCEVKSVVSTSISGRGDKTVVPLDLGLNTGISHLEKELNETKGVVQDLQNIVNSLMIKVMKLELKA